VYHDLLIEGETGAAIEWHDSRGPFIRIGGTDTTLVVRHLQFDTRNTNSNLIGDPNMAYGETPVGVRPHVILEDLVSMPAVHVINLWSPGGTIEVHGGRYGGITGGNLERVAVTPLTRPDGSVELTYLVGTPIGAGGNATVTCVICIGNVNVLEIDGLRSEWDGDIRLSSSILRARIGANVESVRVQLTDDFMHESGTLPLPPGRALDFRLSHGVIEY
jgi:hypothetical protein